MKTIAFDRNKHIYKNASFVELVKDAIRFFNGTPVWPLPPPEKFLGTGVYAIYYTGSNKLYKRYAEINRLSYAYPIYVGKAVPMGWRKSRVSDSISSQSHELYRRLCQHHRSISHTSNLEPDGFMCRFVIFEDESSDMIGTIEAALIKLNRPLWNIAVDGFGNHDPGSGRYEGAKPDWDVIHPGRKWVTKCKGAHNTEEKIKKSIVNHLKNLVK